MNILDSLRVIEEEGYTFAGDAADEIERLRAEIDRLREYVKYDATCFGCQQTVECEDGCSFADDSPSGAEKMNYAREVLKGLKCETAESFLFVTPLDGKCDHDWVDGSDGPDSCRKCGLSFTQYVRLSAGLAAVLSEPAFNIGETP